MRSVALPSSLLTEMRAHGREAYPDECCGFLVADASREDPNAERTIRSLVRAQNTFDGERRRRFLIRPEELQATERALDATGRSVVGFYHSHPDHPARPSEFDQEHAWPWYSYIVLAVTKTEEPAVGAFELDPETSVFREVRLRIGESALPAPASVAER